ncbi:MAG: ClpXP protease specificity-enhancing factor [Lautropia sp.]|nr:ClpXP protease specificity-enhancing factor [Lautropia sp.]
MAETSTKPYMIRAIYEWCCDNGYTPYLAVKVDGRTLVPVQHVRNGEIVLNISPLATNAMQLGNDLIEFQARFNGVPEYLSVPIGNVLAIYARETGSGMAFSPELEEGFDEAVEVDAALAESQTAEPAASPAPAGGGEVLAFARPPRGGSADRPETPVASVPTSAADPKSLDGGRPSQAGEAPGKSAEPPAVQDTDRPQKGRKGARGAEKDQVAGAPQPAASQPASATAQPEKSADTPRVGQNTGIGPEGGDEPPPAGGGGRPRLVRVK